MPPEAKLVMKHFFGLVEPKPAAAGQLNGIAASAGTVTGTARVLSSPDEGDRLEPGDILVCVTTAPPWTPLFAIAGGVVTDTGGVLCHSAICAREYGIPAVVGTMAATAMIPDGATITIDGATGTVTVH
jgi:pyruvate,water dikinase